MALQKPPHAGDPWQAAIAAFGQRFEPLPGWPMHKCRAVRLEDDEPHETEIEVQVERLIGALPREFPEADRRILYALARHGDASQRALAKQLDMDRAYLSRRLRKLADAKHVRRTEGAWRLFLERPNSAPG